MYFGKICLDIFRSFIWMVTSAALWFMDLLYSWMLDLARLDLGDFNFVWGWFKGLCVLLAFFIIVRMVLHYLRAMLNDDEIDKIDPISLVKRVILLGLILVVLPSFLTGLSQVSSEFTANIGSIVTGVDQQAINKPSNIIIATGYSGDLSTFDISKVDINAQENGQYTLFPQAWDIIFVLAVSVVSVYLLFFITIQVAQRIVGLLLKIMIAPFALSGIVDPSDNTMSLWFKLCTADFLTGFFQILLVLIALTSTTMLPVDVFPKAFFFIGALMAVMNAPAGIAQLLGGDVGVGTAFQQMQSLMMLGQGMQMTGSIAKTGVALATYGGGRMMGGKSMLNPIGRNNGSSSGMGGSADGGGAGGTGNAEQSFGTDSGGGETFGGFLGDSGSSGVSRPNTFAGWAATKQGNFFGRGMNQVGSSLYRASAERLSRPITRRTRSGTMYQKNNVFVGASHVAHNTAEAWKGPHGE